MGQEIASEQFTDEDRRAFRARLRDETKVLKRWFDERAFVYDEKRTVGLELEGWLVDGDRLPCPRNEAFFDAVDDPDVVAELSKFNFEINAPARELSGDVFMPTLRDLEKTVARCRDGGRTLGLDPVFIGILPTARDDMLQTDWMSDSHRYRALNRQLLHLRGETPIRILIEGADRLDFRCEHIMLEAACTSLQSHLKVNQEDAVRLYNASIMAAGPLIAATANAPFLYGRSLWAETRVPAFEQVTASDEFTDAEGRKVRRVTLGQGYLRHSFLEPFLQNLAYDVLLPELMERTEKLPHLKLQNGVIWRWVRPILGFEPDGAPHLRLEHRVMPAGPSLKDTVANLALCHGLVLSLAGAARAPEDFLPFEDARANFYACARDGLDAAVVWNGRKANVQQLLLDRLLPDARRALEDHHVAGRDLVEFFDGVLIPRMRTGMTGAAWQRSHVACHGPNFQEMTERYVALQEDGAPVHEWPV